ncbi:MAG: response regulator [Xanthomonadales bacterium]|nr:response regulator [Xanthomonadales bacterium]
MNTNAKNVLVIDDDAVVGRSFDRVLTDKGYRVDTALTGEEGLKDIDEREYDIVFTDIRMPGMDGLEVAERIKARYPETPVVVITGYGTLENETKASALGVNGFVRKPLTPETIESVTRQALQEIAETAEAANEPVVAATEVPEAPRGMLWKTGRVAKNIALFFAAPFIALAYIVALPFVGFYMFVKLAHEAFQKRRAHR